MTDGVYVLCMYLHARWELLFFFFFFFDFTEENEEWSESNNQQYHSFMCHLFCLNCFN